MATRAEQELKHQFRMRLVQVVSVGWEQLIRAAMVACVCLCIYFCIRELAGKQTLADIRFRMIADLKANRWMAVAVPWGLTAATTAWGAGERYLRKRHIRRVSSEASEMQKRLDPGRRSSNLSKTGETNREDQ
jgi:negative regulator of sigma E activity